MKDKLVLIQKLLKEISRSALNSEFDIDVEVSNGQWNSWTQEHVVRSAKTIEDDVKLVKRLLKELKKGE